MSAQNTDPQINPLITPYTWQLNQNLKKHTESLLSDKKYVDDCDNVCSPGHSLVTNISKQIFSSGLPGFSIEEIVENPTEHTVFDILSRGLTSPDILVSFLPSIGRYILYLWVLDTIAHFGVSGCPSEIIPFGYRYADDELQSYPAMGCQTIDLEWGWIREFLILSERLCQPELDIIPPFWKCSRKDTIAHPIWKEKQLALQRGLTRLPFVFRQADAGKMARKILVTPQRNNLFLLMPLMAELEKQIHEFLEREILPTWEKMRSQGDLRKNKMDKSLLTRFNWQLGHWRDALIKDRKLHATVAHATYTGNHKDDFYKIWKGEARKSLDKLNKRRDDIRPGKSQTKTELDPKAIGLIMELGSDLVKILDAAWPIDKKIEPGTGIRELKKQVKKLTLKKIRANHFNFSWEKIHDRLDFQSKIVAEYLEDITGNRYKISILRNPIQDILSKTSSRTK